MGQGVSGVVGVSPQMLDFGLVGCGKQATAQSVSILNTGNLVEDARTVRELERI